MRPLMIPAVVVGCAAILSALSADGQQQGKAKEKIGRPIFPQPQPAFRVAVQSKPLFPEAERGKPSEPATEKGLSITLQPERKTFAGNGPLAFRVTLENRSDKAFLLYGAERLGEKAKLVISNLKTAVQWEPGAPVKGKRRAAVKLEAGKSITYSLLVQPVIAFPRPLPRPLPKRQPQPEKKQQGKKPQAGIAVIAPPRRPVPIITPVMPCGMGPCRARLLLEFQTDPVARYDTPQWTGRIASKTVDFTLGKPEPIKPPVVGPPVVGPVTKERAVTIAHAAAERALDAHYKPAAPARPPHEGQWIADPQKTARVKQQQGGGWTVAWTQVPKGKGFSLNVTVNVSRHGAATVREVFAAYSAR